MNYSKTYKAQDGCLISYEVYKNIVPKDTIFLHGNLSSNKWWYPALEFIEAAKRPNGVCSGSVILIEFRGFGKTANYEPKSININQFCDDVLEVMSETKMLQPNIVGHSTGGIVSAILLAKNPQLFDKVILLDPVNADGFRLTDKHRKFWELMEKDKNTTALSVASIIKDVDINSDFFVDIANDAFLSVASGFKVFEDLDKLNVIDLIKQANNKNNTLVLHGELDNFISLEGSRKLAEMLNAKFEIVKNYSHSLNLENPKLFVDIINNFLFTNN